MMILCISVFFINNEEITIPFYKFTKNSPK